MVCDESWYFHIISCHVHVLFLCIGKDVQRHSTSHSELFVCFGTECWPSIYDEISVKVSLVRIFWAILLTVCDFNLPRGNSEAPAHIFTNASYTLPGFRQVAPLYCGILEKSQHAWIQDIILQKKRCASAPCHAIWHRECGSINSETRL